MPSFDESYPGVFAALAERYGYPPRDTAVGDEAVLSAFLRRVLDARRAAAALDALRDAGLLETPTLADADPVEIADVLRQRKLSPPPRTVKTLRALARWLADWGSALGLADVSTQQLREELLAINGIGPASADAILLFGLRRPVYPVDRATYRVFIRHGWLDATADYDEARGLLQRREPDHPSRLAHLSYWFELIGAQTCRTTIAKCDRCPLRPFLPEGGPLDPGV